jgi:hypothetical protein
MQLPHGYAPLHLCRNQRWKRRTAVQKAYNRPAVVRPLSFAATGGPTWGPRPTCHATGAPVLGAEKLHRRSRQYHVSSGPSQKTEKISFQNQCSDSRHPAWPNSDIKYKGHGPINRGNRRGSRRDHRRACSNCINRRAGAAGQSPIRI